MLANRSSSARCPSEGWRAHGLALAVVGLAATLVASAQQPASAVDRAFRSFWAAPNAAGAADRIEPILKTGISFGEALERVRHGPDYSADVPRGLQFDHHRTMDGIEHDYAFVVPREYDPSRPYQVRFYLHGGIARARAAPVNRIRVDALPSGVDEIRVFPNGWVRALWWSSTQADNLARILDRLKRTYNIDENRVYLTGSSDGGTGCVLHGLQGPDRVGELHSDDWQHAGARHAVSAYRRRDVSRKRGQQAALCRQHRAGSALSRARR